MFHVKYLTLVPYSVEQMFHLVNDINSYTKFLPGCNFSKILEQNGNKIIAEMNIVANGIMKSLVTQNISIENQSIFIFLIKGPFKSFYGCWKFIPVTHISSKVEYISNYEFKSVFFEKFFNYIVQEKYKNIIKAFISRADKIYGTQYIL